MCVCLFACLYMYLHASTYEDAETQRGGNGLRFFCFVQLFNFLFESPAFFFLSGAVQVWISRGVFGARPVRSGVCTSSKFLQIMLVVHSVGSVEAVLRMCFLLCVPESVYTDIWTCLCGSVRAFIGLSQLLICLLSSLVYTQSDIALVVLYVHSPSPSAPY